MDSLPLKMPVISGNIGIWTFAETDRNRLAFDNAKFHISQTSLYRVSCFQALCHSRPDALAQGGEWGVLPMGVRPASPRRGRCLAQLRIDSREKPVLELEKDRSSKMRGRAPEQRKETAAPRAAETRDGKLCAAAAGDPL